MMKVNAAKNKNIKYNTEIDSAHGITLIALIITIIILIILAGVAINLSIGENGIFKKAADAKEKYEIETIREKVEIGIMNLEVDEVALGNEVSIELVLQELLEGGTFESIDKEAQIGNIGEYEVKLKYNEEGKVIIEYIQKATGIRAIYTLEPVGYTNGEKVNILLKVQGKVKEITKPDGLKIYSDKEVLAIDYEVTANGEYKFIIEDEEGNKQEKNVIVDTIDRLAQNDFEITGANTGTGIKVTAEATDAESDGVSVKSGIEKYEYFVKLESETEYTKYETNEIEGLDVGIYDVYVIAYDKAGNSKQSSNIEVEVKLIIKFSKISAAGKHSLGIDLEGNLWSWGINSYGVLGNETIAVSSPSQRPIKVKEGTKFKEISTGEYYTLAIDVEGNLWAWGYNYYGQLGDGTTTQRNSPVKIGGTKFNKIAAANTHSLAIDEEGNLWAWGRNTSGQLGDGTRTDSLVPQKILVEGTTFNEISVGLSHSLAIDEEGNLWAWGSTTGLVPDGSLYQVSTIPKKISSEVKFKNILATYKWTHAIDVEGNLWMSGDNYYEILQNQESRYIVTLQQINFISNLNKIVKEKNYNDDSYLHYLAIDNNKKIWTWGYNYYGALGNGTTTKSYIYEPIKILDNINFKDIAVGTSFCLALDEEGNLWAWGKNSATFGDGTATDSYVPKKVFE